MKYALIAGLCALGACTANIDLRYRPQSPAAYVPGAENVAIFVAPVEDSSGGIQDLSNSAGVKVHYARPMAEGIREALAAEVRRIGFPVAPTIDQADAVLRATLMSAQIWVADLGTFHFSYHSKMLIDLALEDRSRRRIWTGGVEGDSQTRPGSGSGPVYWNGFFNTDLSNAMAKLEPALAWVDLFKVNARGAAPARPASPAPAAQAEAMSDVDRELPSAGKSDPHRHAVVIGIESYREKLPKADFAEADARLAAEYFKRALGVPDENLALLTGGRATRSDMEKYLESWLPNRVEKGDEVFVYFSGHGAPDPEKGAAFLVPYDGDPTYIEKTGYPVDRLYAQLGRLPAKRVVVVLDSCFSGAGGRSVLAAGARPLVTVTVSAAVPPDMTVVAAAAGGQISNAYPSKGHGLFTYFFLKGLKEKGDDLRAVFDYLRPEVARVARRDLNSDQTPQWRQGQ